MIALAIVVSILVTASGFYAVRGFTALNDIRRDDTLMPSGAPTSTATGPAPLNFVLMGSDTLGGERGRSDTLMLAHLNAERNKIYLISFPRDMYVTIPGHGEHKINAAYSYGGSALAVETLESLLDIRMDHAVKVEFDGFIRLTEHLGGVTVFNPHASVQGPYTFPRGEITITGDEALAYVRERYGLPDGDLGRAARQRAVVKAIALKLLRPEVIGDPITFNEVASRLGKNFVVDSGLTNEAMLTMALGLKVRKSADIESLSAPILGLDTAFDDIDIVNFAQLGRLAAALRDDTLDRYQATFGSVPDAVAVDSTARETYVTHFDSGTVSVIDTQTAELTTTITVGDGPEGVAIDPAEHLAYVTNGLSGTVSVIDTTKHTVTATIPVGTSPNRLSGITIDPGGKKLYVGDMYRNVVLVIDTGTRAVMGSIPAEHPWTLAVNPTGQTLYVTTMGSGKVSIVDTSSRKVIGKVTAGGTSLRMAAEPDGQSAYVVDRERGAVVAIDPARKSTTTIPVGQWPQAVATDRTRQRLFVANEMSDTVSVIDTAANRVIDTIAVSDRPRGLAVDPVTHTLAVTYVAHDSISVISVG